MSLSKIVGNLRSKLKDEERKAQVLALKIDQLLKEKEQIKNTVSNMKREKKLAAPSTAPIRPKTTKSEEPSLKKFDPPYQMEQEEPTPRKRLSFK